MGKPMVLILSTSDALQSLAKKALFPRCEVIGFKTFKEGFDFFSSCVSSIKVILLDHNLVKDSFKEKMVALHGVSYIPEVIMLSENPVSVEIWREALKLGAFDYLAASLSETSLKDSVGKALIHSSVLQKLNIYIGETFMESFSHRLELVQDVAALRRSRGETFSDEELMAFFPFYERHETDLPDAVSLFSEQGKNHQKPVIMVVDDEDEVRDILKDFLRERGYVVLLASNAAEAIVHAQQHAGIHLFLLDIGLPDLNGVDLLKRLKQLSPEAEAVMLSAFKEREKIRDSFQLEVFDYLTKPFQDAELEMVVSKALQRCYFKKIVRQHLDSNALFKESFTVHARLALLADIASKRIEEGKPFLIEDLYLFFPELRQSNIDAKQTVSKSKLEAGLLHVFDELKQLALKNRVML